MGGAGFERAERVGDRAPGVVVHVRFDVAMHATAEGADQVVDLPGVGHADGVGDPDAVDPADAVDGAVDVEEVDEVGAEGVFGGEADFEALGFDEGDDLEGGFLVVVCRVSGAWPLARGKGGRMGRGMKRCKSIRVCNPWSCHGNVA